MEIIFVLLFLLILVFGGFLLLEHPYYLVSIFIFLHLYDFNIELPIPLDVRGLLSLSLFLRLIVFDKSNLSVIRESLTNKFFVMIIFISLYSSFVDYFSGISLLKLLRLNILNLVALMLGFITVYNGHGKKIIVLAIVMAGLFSTGDLIFSYFVKGGLLIKRVIDIIVGTLHQIMNHNFFGAICGHALLISFLLLITKKTNKLIAFILIAIFTLGIVISTSRMTFLAVIATIGVILLTQKTLQLNIKKIFVSFLVGVVLLSIVSLFYSYILSSMNLKSEFANELEFRLIDEPLSFFNDEKQNYGWDDNRVQGTMRWRYYKILRDIDVFFKQNTTKILFGFGTDGYKNIGQVQYRGNEAYQYSAHNFYINTIAENGVVGLSFILLFIFLLAKNGVQIVINGQIQFSVVYLLIYMLIYSVGGDSNLTGKFAYLLYGSIIGEIIYSKFESIEFPKNIMKIQQLHPISDDSYINHSIEKSLIDPKSFQQFYYSI